MCIRDRSSSLEDLAKSATEKARPTVAKFNTALGTLLKEGYSPAAEALKTEDTKNVARILEEKISPLNNPVKESLKELNDFYKQDYTAGEKAAEAAYANQRQNFIALISISIVLAMALGFLLIRGIDKVLNYASKQLSDIAQGPVSYTHLTLPTIYSV